jgi:hypothetical protein
MLPHPRPRRVLIFLGIKNLTVSGQLDYSSLRHISDNDFSRWTKRIEPQEGDIVFSYEATLHFYALIPTGFKGCLGRRLALIRPEPDRRNRLFLFCSLLGERWRGTMEANKISGAIYWQPDDRRGLSPLVLARRAYESYPESFGQALKRLDKVSREDLVHIVERVPDGWMSGLSRTFAVELMCCNADQLRRIAA